MIFVVGFILFLFCIYSGIILVLFSRAAILATIAPIANGWVERAITLLENGDSVRNFVI